MHSVGDIVIFQPNPNIIWVGTGERASRQSVGWGDGIYKTTDAGKTWTNVGLKDSKHIGRIVAHPTNPDVVWVGRAGARYGDRAVIVGSTRRPTAARRWARTLFVDDDTGVTDVAIDPSDPSVRVRGVVSAPPQRLGFNGGGPGSALWKSTDEGTNWTKLTGNGLPGGEYGRIGISVYRKNPNIVYISIEQGFRQRLDRATPSGARASTAARSKGGSGPLMPD